MVVAYALSPIDLIPDFIPVLGLLDDLILLPLGVLAVVRMIPPAVMDHLRAQAAAAPSRPRALAAALVIVCLWASGVVVLALLTWPVVKASIT
jgi:uncharacterized membrane protein YkvA (DUF1232 family)